MVPPNTLETEFGADTPTQIWRDYTEAALLGQPAIAFPAPNPNEIPAGSFVTAPNSPGFSTLPPVTSFTPRTTFVTPVDVPPTAPPRTVPPPPPSTVPITTPTTRSPPPTTCVTISRRTNRTICT
jgi:hypothetical protein